MFSYSPSITKRLTFFYAIFTSLLLVLSSIFLYAVLTTDLERGDTKFLADETEGLRAIIKESGDDPKGLEEEVKWEASAGKLLKYYARVLDENGKVVIETIGIDKIGDIQKIPFPKPFDIGESPDDGTKWESPKGNAYLLMTAWAQTKDGKGRRFIQLISDITDDEILAAHYRQQLFTALAVGILLASVVGIFITRNGLKPLKDITRSIQRISATQLHERISQEKWPKELISLSHEFDKMLDRFENSFSRLSQFSGDLAHELRTPINRLMGEAEVTLSKKRTLGDCLEVIESSLEEYAILSRMIDNLLFLARAENPETVIERTISEARREVEVVIEYYDALLKESDIKVLCEGNATLSADFSLFRRALSNLLSNAIRYSPSGSQIAVSIRKNKDNFIEIKVCDHGSGISSEHSKKIFNRFYRTDFSRSEHPKGMGLGLSIVKSIMKLHGGEVLVDSIPAKGTTFILKFPS